MYLGACCLPLQAINQAQRKGQEIDTSKKCKAVTEQHKLTVRPPTSARYDAAHQSTISLSGNSFCYSADAAATNKQKSASRDTAKLDRETEELHREPGTLCRCWMGACILCPPQMRE